MANSSSRCAVSSGTLVFAALAGIATVLGTATGAAAQIATGSGVNQGTALSGTQLLAVDINGTTSTSGTTETQAAGTTSFQGVAVANAPNVNSLAFTLSGITTTITAEGADSSLLLVSRNRNVFTEASKYGNLYNDFLNEPSNASNPTTGANVLQIAFTGLSANTTYAFTMYALDPTQESGVYNFGTGTVNSPTSFTAGTILGSVVDNTSAQGTPSVYDPYLNTNANYFSTTFNLTSNSAGGATFYEYASYIAGNSSYNQPQQSAGVLNGFVISTGGNASSPEPISLALVGFVLPILGLARRGSLVRRTRCGSQA